MTKADCEKKKDLRERLLGVMIPPGLLPRLPWWHILGYFTILKRKTLGRNVYNDDPARADSTNSLSDNFCTAEEYLVAVIFALRRPSLRSWKSQRGTFSPKTQLCTMFPTNRNYCLHHHHGHCLVTKHNEAVIIRKYLNCDNFDTVVHTMSTPSPWSASCYNQPASQL